MKWISEKASSLKEKLNLPFLLVALLLAGSLLAACQEAPAGSPTTAATRTGVDTPTPKVRKTSTPVLPPTPTPEPVSLLDVQPEELSGVQLEFWHAWSGEAGDAVRDLVQGYNAENEWGIEVVSRPQGNLDDMAAAVQQALSQGEPPDIAVGFAYQALSWEEQNELVDWSAYVQDPIWGLSQLEQEDFFPAFWTHDATGERRWGVPAQRTGQTIYYNQTWAGELGFDEPPDTPQEFRRQACAAARFNREDDNRDNDGTGGWVISTEYAAMLGWMYAYDAQTTRNNGYRFDSQAVEKALTFLRELYDEGCAWLPDGTSPQVAFANRQALFAAGSVTEIPYQWQSFDRAGNYDQWTVIPFPSPTAQPAISVLGPSYVAFTATPERELASWLFVRWMVSPENQARLARSNSSFPTRASAMEFLQDYETQNPQWAAAVELLPVAKSEPSFRSWRLVRWAVQDAATQLFRSYFSVDRVPDLIELLDDTAAELHQENGAPSS